MSTNKLINIEQPCFIPLRAWYCFLFFLQHRKLTICIIVIAIALILLVSYYIFGTFSFTDKNAGSQSETNTLSSHNLFDWLTLASTFIVFAVWLAELTEAWKNSLKIYMTVDFFNPNATEPIGFLHHDLAPLLAESDARSLAQSIGQIKNKNNRLNFNSTRQALKKAICIDRQKDHSFNCGKPFWHYEISMYLLTDLQEPSEPKPKDPSTEKSLAGIHALLAQHLNSTTNKAETPTEDGNKKDTPKPSNANTSKDDHDN